MAVKNGNFARLIASVFATGMCGSPVFAHGITGNLVPLHLVKSTALSRSLVRSSLLNSRIPGFSGSQSIFYNQVKSLTGIGVTQGLIKQVTNNPIVTGQTFGTLYQSPNSPQSFGNVYLEFGNNPFNSPNVVLNTTPVNSFTYAKGAPPSGVAFFSVNSSLRLSGAARILQNQLNTVAGNAVLGGERLGVTGLTGGTISGFGFDHLTGTSYVGSDKFVYAFGNSPLNTQITGALPNSTLPVTTNFLNFKNKINISISSGQVSGEFFVGNGTLGAQSVFLALGKNPFNSFSFFGMTITQPAPLSALNIFFH